MGADVRQFHQAIVNAANKAKRKLDLSPLSPCPCSNINQQKSHKIDFIIGHRNTAPTDELSIFSFVMRNAISAYNLSDDKMPRSGVREKMLLIILAINGYLTENDFTSFLFKNSKS